MKNLSIALAVAVILPAGFASCKKKKKEEPPPAAVAAPAPVKPAPKYKALAALKDMAKARVAKYAEMFSKMDSKFPGALAFGKTLAGVDASKLDADALTVKSPDFWRATMELRTDPGAAFAAAYLYALQGNLRKADAWLLLGSPGTDAAMKADQETLKRAVADAEAEMAAAVKKGSDMLDAKMSDEAVKTFDELIADHPQNAAAFYGKEAALKMKDAKATEKERGELLAKAAALYPFQPDASRKDLKTLHADVLPFLQGKGALKDFAAGCEKLGAYDFAAQAFWLLTLAGKAQNQMMPHFYYSLKKAGLASFVEQTASDRFKKEVEQLEGIASGQDAGAEDEVQQSGVLASCKAEVGMLCNSVRKNPNAALDCVKRYQFEGGISKGCRKFLKSLESSGAEEE